MRIARRQATAHGQRNASSLPGKAGSAVLIVLVLVSLMAALMVSNAVVLRRLRVELQLLDQKQQQRISQPSETNQPAARLSRP